MKLGAIIWTSFVPLFVRASRKVKSLKCAIFSSRELEENPEKVDIALKILEEQDIIFLYRSSESFWTGIEDKLKEMGKKTPIVCLGHDLSYWVLSTVKPQIVAALHAYMVNNGEENFMNMLKFLCREIGGETFEVEPPKNGKELITAIVFYGDGDKAEDILDFYPNKWQTCALPLATNIAAVFQRLYFLAV